MREIGDRQGEANALGNLGLAWAASGEPHDRGKLMKALELYGHQLTIARHIGDRRGEGNALWNSALAHDQLGEHEKAISNARAALVICRQIEDPNATKVESWLRARGIDPDQP